jgi:hypothetical protein
MRRPDRAIATLVAFLLALAMAITLFVMVSAKSLWMAVGVVGFTSVLIASIASAELGLYCLVLAALFEGIYKGFAPGLFTLLVKDMLLAILLIRLFWVSQTRHDYRWLHQAFTLPAVVFVLYTGAMMFAPSTRSWSLALAGFRAWILWMPLYYPVWQIFRTKAAILRFLVVLMAIQLPVSIYGIIQGNIGYEHTKFIPGFYERSQFFGVEQEALAEDPNNPTLESGTESVESGSAPIMRVRACSVYSFPSELGSMSFVTVMVALGLLGILTSVQARFWLVSTALAGSGALMASGSRTPMVALGLGLAVYALVSRRRAMAILGVTIIVFGSIYLISDYAGAGAARLRKMTSLATILDRTAFPLVTGYEQALAHPLGNGIATGVGAGRMGAGQASARGARWVENEVGRALAELGFMGTFLWLTMIFTAVYLAYRNVRSMGASAEGMLAAGLFGGMICIVTQLGTGAALYAAHAGMYFWILAAAVNRLGDIYHAEHVVDETVQSTQNLPTYFRRVSMHRYRY